METKPPSLVNCHVRGVDSYVIDVGPDRGLVRAFHARSDHELWHNQKTTIWQRLHKDNVCLGMDIATEVRMSVAFHTHGFNARITNLLDPIYDVRPAITHEDTKDGYFCPLGRYWYDSKIKTGGGGFRRDGIGWLSGLSSVRMKRGTGVYLPWNIYHTVFVPKGCEAIWVVEELPVEVPPGRKMPEMPVYSNACLESWSADGLYQPMPPEQEREFVVETLPMLLGQLGGIAIESLSPASR